MEQRRFYWEKGIELSKFYVTRKRSKEGRQKKNTIW